MKQFLQTIIFSMSCICLFSCNGNKVKEIDSKIRFINASSLSGDINVFIDYRKVFATDIQYLNYSLFSTHISTSHRIQIKDIGSNIIKDTTLIMEANKTYSAFLYDYNNTVQFKILEEDFSTPVGSFCKLRFLHLSNNAPPSDISRANDTSVLFNNYSNGNHSDYIIFPTDSMNFKASYAGTNSPYYIQPRHIQFKAGAFYTLYLKGNIGSTGIDSIGFFAIENNGNY